MNNLMLDGKKSVAESIVYGALDARAGPPEARAGRAVPRSAGQCEALGRGAVRRVGGRTYQVPVEVRTSAARRWRSAG